ncbi:class D beta-lactamase [Nostocales cyanobacterium HT-58-2]|nr:class D beta-lactamase [Nostocales cyanobacterium HT-58-2]
MIRRIGRSPLTLLIIISSLILLLIIVGFRAIPAYSQSVQPASGVSANKIDLARSFRELGIEGSILIYDQNRNQFYEHNAPRNSRAFFPGSTFKILNALVALETGVIRDDVSVLTWDGIKRKFDAWNKDTNLRQGFKDSTIWFYQVLARKAGHEQMQKFINQVGYGNRQIGTPENIDRFWLEGPLQITPKQEIEFLQKLYRKDLPFSQRTLDLVKDIMVFERTPNYVLRGKTGWVDSVSPEIGWFVGYLEQNKNVYFFATNIDMEGADAAASRIEITRRSLKELGLL